MTPYIYPKVKHARKHAPPQFKRYQTYKRFLQHEFARKCVYCCAADTNAVGVVFGVDHYRPKDSFPGLIRTYSNLYYCCSACNSRKREYWPNAKNIGNAFIPNPCDHVMFSHLRFRDGVVEGQSPAGRHTVFLLDLNDSRTVAFRKVVLHTIELLLEKIDQTKNMISQIEKKIAKGGVDLTQAKQALEAVKMKKSEYEVTLQYQLGTLPLKIPSVRNKNGPI